MSKYQELQARLDALHLEAAALQEEGECLQDCWLERTPAGGTARGVGTTSGRYRTLRSRKALSGGKKSQYIPLEKVAATEAAIARGRQLTRLQRQIKAVESEMQGIEETAARLGLEMPATSSPNRQRRSDRTPARSTDVQGIPNGTKVKVPRGWEAVITGYLGENRYAIRYSTGLPGQEDSYPAHCLTVE